MRQAIEEATDRLSVYAYEAIGEEGCDTLRGLARPLRAVWWMPRHGLTGRAGRRTWWARASAGEQGGESVATSARPWAVRPGPTAPRRAGSSTSMPKAASEAASG